MYELLMQCCASAAIWLMAVIFAESVSEAIVKVWHKFDFCKYCVTFWVAIPTTVIVMPPMPRVIAVEEFNWLCYIVAIFIVHRLAYAFGCLVRHVE